MNNLEGTGRILIAAGVFFIIAGMTFYALSRLGITGFKLPGDIIIRRDHITIYFPLATLLLISLLLTLVVNLIFRR